MSGAVSPTRLAVGYAAGTLLGMVGGVFFLFPVVVRWVARTRARKP